MTDNNIYYSAKYYDDEYEYRLVFLSLASKPFSFVRVYGTQHKTSNFTFLFLLALLKILVY